MNDRHLTSLHLENFTAFEKLDLEFSPGVNVFIGGNGTGKTHVLKVLYSLSRSTGGRRTPYDHLVWVFLPSFGEGVGLNRFDSGHTQVVVGGPGAALSLDWKGSEVESLPNAVLTSGFEKWRSLAMEPAFIPAKEILANAPGFLSLWEKREVHFEEVYPDLLKLAYLPPLHKEQLEEGFSSILNDLVTVIGGPIVLKGEGFFRRQGGWDVEFTLLAEGHRKLGLLWLLIRNGTIKRDSILFWDEPEANLNPSLVGKLADILLRLQRAGVQIFLATHDYVVIKEFDLRKKENDQVRFFSFYIDKAAQGAACTWTDDFDLIDPNLILDTFVNLHDRDLDRALGGEPGE